MDFSDIDNASGEVGGEVQEVESKDSDFGDGDGVNDFDDTYNEMNSGNETMEYSSDSDGDGTTSDGKKGEFETTDGAVDDELEDFDDSSDTAVDQEVQAPQETADNVEQNSNLNTDESVDDALSDFDDSASDEQPEGATDATAESTDNVDETEAGETSESDQEEADEATDASENQPEEAADTNADNTEAVDTTANEEASESVSEESGEVVDTDESQSEDNADATSEGADNVDETEAGETSESDQEEADEATDASENQPEEAADTNADNTEAVDTTANEEASESVSEESGEVVDTDESQPEDNADATSEGADNVEATGTGETSESGPEETGEATDASDNQSEEVADANADNAETVDTTEDGKTSEDVSEESGEVVDTNESQPEDNADATEAGETSESDQEEADEATDASENQPEEAADANADNTEAVDTTANEEASESVSEESGEVVDPNESQPEANVDASTESTDNVDAAESGEASETGEATDASESQPEEAADANADNIEAVDTTANEETSGDGPEESGEVVDTDESQPEDNTEASAESVDNVDATEPGEASETGEATDASENQPEEVADANADNTEAVDTTTNEEASENGSEESGEAVDTNESQPEDTADASAESTDNVDATEVGETSESGSEETSEATDASESQSEELQENAENVSSYAGSDANQSTEVNDGTNSNGEDTSDGDIPKPENDEKTAMFENVSYHQGQNDFGARGTCGPTSIANSLNRVTGTSDYTENAVLHNAMDNDLCSKSWNPNAMGGTTTDNVVSIIDNVKNPDSNIHTEVYEYDKALSVDELADKVDNPGTVAMVGVDSATLWDQRGDVVSSGLFQHSESPSDHWITVDSPTRDSDGNVTGFNIIDSGGGVDYVDRDKFEAMYQGDVNHTVSDPTAIIISNQGDATNTYETTDGVERTSNYKGSAMESDGGDPPNEIISYDEFKNLTAEEQSDKFGEMSSEQIYDMVKNSSESWPVDCYDKITPENAKDFIVLNVNDAGETSFNLDWPKYGGYDPSSISSVGELSGKVDVSRDGGDGGYTMGIGRNADGTYSNNSERSIPKSSAEVNTGTFDVDRYKEAVDIVSSDASDDEKIAQLTEAGFDFDSSINMLSDYEDWKSRPEIAGDNNIAQGAKMASVDGQGVDMKYGVYGKAAAWDVGDVHMVGGAGQMNTVFSWGTCRESGIISDCGKAKIN